MARWGVKACWRRETALDRDRTYLRSFNARISSNNISKQNNPAHPNPPSLHHPYKEPQNVEKGRENSELWIAFHSNLER